MLNAAPLKLNVRITHSYRKEDSYLNQVTTMPLPNVPLSNALRDEVSCWRSNQPVFIEAPMGSGKTTFVFNTLIPMVLQRGTNLLLLSNRIALSVQQKCKIMDVLNSPLKSRLTTEGIRCQEEFGPIRVLTYHRLPALLHDPDAAKWLQHVEYVVCDESHFFTADALFNPYCDYLLQSITKIFRNAVRVYMSATPDQVLNGLARAEMHVARPFYRVFMPGKETSAFIHYKMESSYDWCRLHFFNGFGELKDIIASVPDSKWLVFVNSKTSGQEIASSLGKQAAYLDADRKSGKVWDTLISEERFEQHVLITTSVLDNGVNIWDDSVRNIIIMADNQVSLIQSLGRKRRKAGETVDLWVCDLSKAAITHRYQSYRESLKWFDRYDSFLEYKEACPRNCTEIRRREHELSSLIWHDENAETLRNFFSLSSGGHLYARELAREALQYQLQLYSSLYYGETTFQNEVRKWLGKPVPVSGKLIDDFYHVYQGELLGDAEQDELRQLILKEVQARGIVEPQPTRLSKLGMSALNNRLTKLSLPYTLTSKDGQWMLDLSN